MKIKLFFFSVIIVSLFQGCANKSAVELKGDNMEIQTLETLYGCINTAYTVSIKSDLSYLIVSNQNDFNRLVGISTCSPTIDFSSSNLLIGKKSLSSGNSSIEYELKEIQPGVLVVNVIFNQNMAQNAPKVVYNVFIPKRFELPNVKVEYQTRQIEKEN